VAVHLAGVLAFLLLGLHHAFRVGRSPAGGREWWWWSLWLASWVTTLTVRASFVTMAVAGALVMALRPTGRWWRIAVIATTLLAISIAFDLELTVGRAGRPISAEGLLVVIKSIYEPSGSMTLDGSRQWRLRWWTDIIGYTLRGDYFWTGKGYGINLADADGYQVFSDGSLRSPHNGHLTILARSGVPGAVSWLALNLVLFGALVRAYLMRRAEGRSTWAHVNLWLATYWAAFVTNASFDVYLEGPMGGIWFWAVVGFALSVLRVQRSTVGDLLPPAGGQPVEPLAKSGGAVAASPAERR
jgi:O-antigen ligase